MVEGRGAAEGGAVGGVGGVPLGCFVTRRFHVVLLLLLMLSCGAGFVFLLWWRHTDVGCWGTEAIQALSRLATRLSTRQGRPKSLVCNEIYGRLRVGPCESEFPSHPVPLSVNCACYVGSVCIMRTVGARKVMVIVWNYVNNNNNFYY